MKPPVQTGNAYGFLLTQSSKKRILEAFSRMKAHPDMMVPDALSIAVTKITAIALAGFPGHSVDPGVLVQNEPEDKAQFHRIFMLMEGKGANRIIRSSLPGSTNRESADELAFIFNLMYSNTEIMKDAEVPVADIFFKNENGVYVSKLQTDTPSYRLL